MAVPNLRTANFAGNCEFADRTKIAQSADQPTKKKRADLTTIFTELQSALHKKMIRHIF